MTTAPAGTKRGKYFIVMAALALAVVLIGFASSLFLRPFFIEPGDALRRIQLAAGAPAPKTALPVYLYVHGAVLTAWFALVLVQTFLVGAGRTNVHRRLGIWGLGLAILVVVTCLLATFRLPARAEAVGVTGSPVVAQLIQGNVVGMVIFTLFVGTAVIQRRKPEVHKRLMLLATLGTLPPAAARLGSTFESSLGTAFATVGPIVLLVALLASMLVYDVSTRRRPHPATVWGLLIVLFAPAIVLAALSSRLPS